MDAYTRTTHTTPDPVRCDARRRHTGILSRNVDEGPEYEISMTDSLPYRSHLGFFIPLTRQTLQMRVCSGVMRSRRERPQAGRFLIFPLSMSRRDEEHAASQEPRTLDTQAETKVPQTPPIHILRDNVWYPQ